MKIVCKNPVEVVKEAFFLAYQACGGATGMGYLKERSNVTKDEVFKNVMSNGDYAGGFKPKPGNAYGDYVFGRMMKLGLKWDENSVECRDETPRNDYQAWCRVYPTYESLVQVAIKNVG